MKYLIPKEGKFYKASMHTHSTMSDGELSPEKVKELYQSMGYSIVAYTDHDMLMPETWLTDDDFVALTAFELEPIVDRKHDNKVHLNLISRNPEKRVTKCFNFGAFTPGNPVDERALSRLTDEQRAIDKVPMGITPERLNGIIKQAKSEGFLVALNHPCWSNMNFLQYIDLKGLWGVEVFNSGGIYTGTPDNFQPAYDLWQKGEMVVPVAADDMHADYYAGQGWMMVKAPELTYDAVFDALEKGNCYSSTGPEILSITLENNVIHVETKEEAEVISLNFKTRPACKRAINTRFLEADISKYLMNPENRNGFINIYVRNHDNTEAWTRAYSVYELLK